ncbi:uncharacterized protein LOC108050573 [Drosophila rhopaloa]|uniref:Uncharacterized protein LOC108050573 n=1 Tax=Drosophila rhopaloa TaxID=1041015 RepID=A0A6P4FCF1_DRORH|nr:uncharacterized protein LOC108050573 [Drosophila rhopaloa]
MRVGGDEATTTMRAIFSREAGGTFKMALPRRSTPIDLTVHGAARRTRRYLFRNINYKYK